MTPEGRVKSMLRTRLNKELGGEAYLFMPVQQGLGAPALDYYCCISGTFVAVETKVPGKKLTARQIITANQIAACGGLVVVVREEADVQWLLILSRRRRGVIYDTLGTVEDYGEFLWPPR